MAAASRAARPRSTVFAVITDIHGNLPALEAVLSDVERRGIRRVLCCGDLTGYGPWPNEVVALLRARKIPAIKGNVDRDALEFHQRRKELKASKGPEKLRSLEYTAGAMDEATRATLRALPIERRARCGGKRVLLTHGSPDGLEDKVRPDDSEARLEQLLARARADILACGHTHVPFARRVGAGLVVNAGTAGRPADGDPRVTYAVIDPAAMSAEIVRVPYDVERVVAALGTAMLPLSFAAMYRTGVPPWSAPALEARAPDPPDDAHLRALVAWRDQLEEGIAAALRGDAEGVHDVRVATRRLRAGLKLLRERALRRGPRRRAARARLMLSELARALSAPRSLQVHLRILEQQRRQAAGEGKLFVEHLMVKRQAQHDAAMAPALEVMRAFPTERLARLVNAAVHRAAIALAPLPEPAEPALGRVREAAAQALETNAPADYHRLRIELKKLRYRLEAASAKDSPLHAAAKAAQDVLGDAHDRDEILAWVAEEEERLRALGADHHGRECRKFHDSLARERDEILARLDLKPFLGPRRVAEPPPREAASS